MNDPSGVKPEKFFNFNYLNSSFSAANAALLVRQAGADIAPHVGLNERILADRLTGAMKQNMSPAGNGVAMMYLRVSGLNAPFHALFRLKRAVDVDAPDGQGVDLFCLVLTPDRDGNAYLHLLARLSRLFRNNDLRARLRAAADEDALRAILEQPGLSRFAA